MPHQCIHCGRIIPTGSKEILEGCQTCNGKFFFYIREEKAEKIKQEQQQVVQELNKVDKTKVEADVRNILDLKDEEEPVILDIESVRVLKPGKFEIDLVHLLNRKPIVFKLEEGKYVIDLESALPRKLNEDKIKDNSRVKLK